MVEVELCDGQQNSGKRQVRAEPTKEGFDAWERSVDQRWVLYTNTVQDTHSLHQTLREKTGQTPMTDYVLMTDSVLSCSICGRTESQ